MFAVFAAAEEETDTTTSPPTPTTDDSNSRCNCDDSCPEKPVIGLKTERSGHKEIIKGPYEEDSDGDGVFVICARNRDEVDRTFRSVCHMMCYNNCTRYRIRKIVDFDEIITYVSAS